MNQVQDLNNYRRYCDYYYSFINDEVDDEEDYDDSLDF